MTVGILSGSHAAEDRLQNQSEQLFKQANERLEQPAPAWKDSPTGGRSRSRLFRAFYENKNHLLSCSCCVFIMPRAVLFFPASRSVCCLFVRYFTATLPIHEFVSLCFLWYSPRGVACITFYFAYYVELNLTQKVSDDQIPKILGFLYRLLIGCRQFFRVYSLFAHFWWAAYERNYIQKDVQDSSPVVIMMLHKNILIVCSDEKIINLCRSITK